MGVLTLSLALWLVDDCAPDGVGCDGSLIVNPGFGDSECNHPNNINAVTSTDGTPITQIIAKRFHGSSARNPVTQAGSGLNANEFWAFFSA
ncbi:MAG: hypothetical protein WA709_16675 [Stellaceae bacterium]